MHFTVGEESQWVKRVRCRIKFNQFLHTQSSIVAVQALALIGPQFRDPMPMRAIRNELCVCRGFVCAPAYACIATGLMHNEISCI